MKKFLTLAALALATASPVLAQKTAHDHVAQHGGVFVEGKEAETLLRLVDALEDHEDVQRVYSNFQISEEVMARLTER